MGQDKSGNRQRTTGNRGYRDQATGNSQGRKRSQANPARGSGEHHGTPRPNPRFSNSNSRFNRLSARDAALRALQDVVRGDAYARLCAEGYVSRDYEYTVSAEGIFVAIAGGNYRLEADGTLAATEGK